MPLFISDADFADCGSDATIVAEKADSFIRELYKQLDTFRAEADAASITAEQTCSLLEQKYISLSSEFSNLQSQYSQIESSLQQRVLELSQLQAQKHQFHLKSIEKDGEIERLSVEASELNKSKRQLMDLLEKKDLEIGEKNATMKTYLDKIVNLTDNAAQREARVNNIETELARSKAMCTRLSQEKELIERHNVWLNEELTAKGDSLNELRRTHTEREADMSSKLTDVDRQFKECSNALTWNKERVKELETKLTSLQEELCSSKDYAASNEERFSAELSTLTKLAELYKESSEEWSKKSGELEGVIKALETHLGQVENEYKEKLEKEVTARKELEKESTDLKSKLEKIEAELEASRKANELDLFPLQSITQEKWLDLAETNDSREENRILIPKIPSGVSGTALAASLLRDGWSLAKMYAKYQETADALRHEQLGRKQSQAILQRVLREIEEKAEIILDERSEHERMVEAYIAIDEKLQDSRSEISNFEKVIRDLKAELKKHERDYALSQKEIVDLQRQVTVLVKECRDIQLQCGYADHDNDLDLPMIDDVTSDDADKIISERLLTFKDINGLVEQNVQLRSLVRSLSDEMGNKEAELMEKFKIELQTHTEEAANKVEAVLKRAQEQGQMIESLHGSVAMYKRLYEEELKLRSSYPNSTEVAPDSGRKDFMFLLESSEEATKKAQERAAERIQRLEEDLAKSRNEIICLRAERDKLCLEANFSREKLERYMKEFEHQRSETNGVLARNVEFSQLIVDYQRRLRENSESVQAAEELSRKLNMEVSILKHEKEMLLNSEKRASDEVRSLSERVYRLQATLETIQSAEEVREEARRLERTKHAEHIRRLEREWAEAKKELQEERDNVRNLALGRENTIKDAMTRVEEAGKELANTLHSVAKAESRAAVAEARCSDLEKRIKSSEKSIEAASTSIEVASDLCISKEELEKLKEEAEANRIHMLQYKSIAQVNEDALKQMENAHENFKIDAEKLKKSLEAELFSLRERVVELESELSLKLKEAASSAISKEEALGSALEEIASLKEDNAVKITQITAMEIQFSALKEDLEKEHQRWHTSQANYERQVILQSETIQELTRTSAALGLLQEKASELQKLADSLRSENNELKAKWEVEKLILEESKSEAEKKYHEINEQNKILLNRVEALHIKLAENDRAAGGISGSDPFSDGGLQNVLSYLRREKEIAETEISLFKQEKLKLQLELESARKESERAHVALNAERASSRAMLFTEEEMKSLQLQVREINLLRESNMQLREENKHNFEECQKLREVAQKARVETEKLELLLKERQVELEACKKEVEMLRVEKEHLERRVTEILERSKNVDVEDCDRLKDDIQKMQVNLREKDVEIETTKKLVSEKQNVISQLEQDLSKSRLELAERETRINDILQVEAVMKTDLDKYRRTGAQLKRRTEILTKEKEDLIKEKQGLSRQLEDLRQGKRSIGDTAGEQAVKEKEKEKEMKIQTLQRVLESTREELKREREELKKGKDEFKKKDDEHRSEKARRMKSERQILDKLENVTQEKTKLVDELERHKLALKGVSDEFEKLKHTKGDIPEVQLLSETALDDFSTAYVSAVDNFEKVARELAVEASALDSSPAVTATAAQPTSSQAPTTSPTRTSIPTTYLPANPTEERESKPTVPKSSTEVRKVARRLNRPRLSKPVEPQGDAEMPDAEASKVASSHEMETQGHTHALKRLASASASELQEEMTTLTGTSSDVTGPLPKKAKGLDVSEEGIEQQENIETVSAIEEPSDVVADLLQDSNEEALDGDRDEVDTTQEKTVEPKEEEPTQQSEANMGEDSLDRPSETVTDLDDSLREQADTENPQLVVESESEREEGEMGPDNSDVDVVEGSETVEAQADAMVDEDALVGEMNSPEVVNDEKNNEEGDVTEENPEGSDKSNDGNEADQVPEASLGVCESSASASKQDKEEVKVVSSSPTTRSSTIISLNERARLNALKRQAGARAGAGAGAGATSASSASGAGAGATSPLLGRGRGRAIRGRGVRGGRAGRGGQSANE